jgi:hypothetical protein
MTRWLGPLPGNIDLAFFLLVARIARQLFKIQIIAVALRAARRAGYYVAVPVLPPAPRRYSGPLPNCARIGLFAFIIAVIACLAANALVAYITGTLTGSDADRLYFAQDYWNHAQFFLIAPSYTAASVCLFVTYFASWGELNALANEGDPPVSTDPTYFIVIRVIGFSILVFVAGAIFIANFANEILDPTVVRRGYWFVDIAPDGARTFNNAGRYYVAMNLALLELTILAVVAYFAISIEVFRMGAYLVTPKFVADYGFNHIKKKLSGYSRCHVLAKLLTAVYVANIYIWKDSPLGQMSNVNIAAIALCIIGIFFVGIPRLYFELKWFEADSELKASREVFSNDSSFELRNNPQKIACGLLDTFFVGGFIAEFFHVSFKMERIFDVFK